jgi:hypothetical protein
MTIKQSNRQYRNIKGVRYNCIEHNHEWFEQLKKESKDKGLLYRIIAGQFYQQVQHDKKKQLAQIQYDLCEYILQRYGVEMYKEPGIKALVNKIMASIKPE